MNANRPYYAWGLDIPKLFPWYETWPVDDMVIIEFTSDATQFYIDTDNNAGWWNTMWLLYEGEYPDNMTYSENLHYSGYTIIDDNVSMRYPIVKGQKYYIVILPTYRTGIHDFNLGDANIIINF